MIRLLVVLVFSCLAQVTVAEEAAPAAAAAPVARQYTFAFPYADADAMKPRGGTSKGAPITLAREPSAAWKALQEPGLSSFERDRRAILAMAGEFRTTFDFLEVLTLDPQRGADRPYQSWGTEKVYVIADSDTRISLQHVLVMRILGEDGKLSEPFVTKHWRQDWQYENRRIAEYRGRNTWTVRELPVAAVRGTWSQAVYQVDDSPRYASFGRWEHNPSFSSWISADTWRPLPRREYTVREDYQVLEGTNRHTVLPAGWVQEENNLKLALDETGKARAGLPFVGREYGIARYERITGTDFSAGDAYWKHSAPLWEVVRNEWQRLFDERGTLTLKSPPDKGQLFMPLFEQAEALDDAHPWSAQSGSAKATRTVQNYLTETAPTTPTKY